MDDCTGLQGFGSEQNVWRKYRALVSGVCLWIVCLANTGSLVLSDLSVMLDTRLSTTCTAVIWTSSSQFIRSCSHARAGHLFLTAIAPVAIKRYSVCRQVNRGFQARVHCQPPTVATATPELTVRQRMRTKPDDLWSAPCRQECFRSSRARMWNILFVPPTHAGKCKGRRKIHPHGSPLPGTDS